MPQTHSHFFDDLSRLMTDAAGLADGAKREAQTFARSQMERMMAGMNVVAREEFEAVKEMAAGRATSNEKLAARVAALEAKSASQGFDRTRIPLPEPLFPFTDLWTPGASSVYERARISRSSPAARLERSRRRLLRPSIRRKTSDDLHRRSADERREHPVYVVERLAAVNEWAFDRAQTDEISILVWGGCHGRRRLHLAALDTGSCM